MYVKFGTDGARGEFSNVLAPEPGIITPESAFRIGIAAVETLTPRRWIMVQDTRVFNPELAEALSEGIYTAGGSVYDLGVLPTPAASIIASVMTDRTGRMFGAISLTASHNPSGSAGIKVAGAWGRKLSDEQTAKLELVANNIKIPENRKNRVEPHDPRMIDNLRNLYINLLLSTIDPETDPEFLKGKKMVIDAANGAAYWSANEVFSCLGADVIPIFNDPEGEINKNCGATHAESMVAAVRDAGANYGMALDGDADRLISFSRQGGVDRLIDGDDAIVIALSGLEAQGRLRVRKTVVTDYSTVGFKREMDRRGVEVLFVDNGDRYVFEGLKGSGAHIGAEQSGHILYPHVAYRSGIALTGDGTLAALEQLAVESRLGKPLAQIANFDRLGYGRADIKVAPGTDTKRIVKSGKVEKVIKDAQGSLHNDGLVLVRGSGTEPIIRVLVKDESQELVDQTIACVNRAVEEALA